MLKSGLQIKFILFTTISIIIFMTIIGYLAVSREKSLLYAEFEKRGRIFGETLAIPILNDLIYERLGLVEEGGLLDNYIMEIYKHRDLDLLYLGIVDEEGKVISHNDIAEYGKLYRDELTVSSMGSERTVMKRIHADGHEAIDFAVPLYIGKKRWGTLRFAVSLEKMEQEIFSTVERIIIITLILIAVAFVLILMLTKRFITPITELASVMERTGSDLLDTKVEVRGTDEIAVLYERFNSMMERIRQANEDLKRSHEKLMQAEKLASIGILAAGVAHEINNPLGGIFNCIQLIRNTGDDPKSREKYLELMEDGLERIESTVSRLLWMARKGEQRPIKINVREFIGEVSQLVEYRMRKNRIEFDNQVEDRMHIFIDPQDFQLLILNLFINAIHAMDAGGRLTVRCAEKDSRVTIEIIDTGRGIEPHLMGKIFDPFFTTKPPGEGTGLGLWLCSEIMKNYDGEIHAMSEPGRGSCFKLIFPGERVIYE